MKDGIQFDSIIETSPLLWFLFFCYNTLRFELVKI